MRNRTSFPLPAHSRRERRHALPALVMIATLVVAAQAASADLIFADWDAGSPGCRVGVWTDNCWGNEPMPNNGNQGHTYIAAISDGIATVTQNISITLNGLVVFEFNTMFLPNNMSLGIVGGSSRGADVGFIDIDGVLHMQSAGNNTDLTTSPGPEGSILRIVGSGDLRMSNNSQNRIYGATGVETIVFGSGLTVGGSGTIGLNLTTLINQGTIIADQAVQLIIDPSNAGMTNSGLMVARDGATLRLDPAPYDNTLGEIRAEDASIVRFPTSSVVTGGLTVAESGGLLDFNGGKLLGPTIRIDFGGVGQVSSPNTTVENLTNHGVINQLNNGTLHTTGQYNNTGDHFMMSGGNNTDLIFDGDTVLDGGGTIHMSNNSQNGIYGATFTNVDNTIRGSGNIGLNQTTIINQGTIIAD